MLGGESKRAETPSERYLRHIRNFVAWAFWLSIAGAVLGYTG